MDYSLLYIKVKNVEQNGSEMRKMPAMVYFKQKNGENALQLLETEQVEI